MQRDAGREGGSRLVSGPEVVRPLCPEIARQLTPRSLCADAAVASWGLLPAGTHLNLRVSSALFLPLEAGALASLHPEPELGDPPAGVCVWTEAGPRQQGCERVQVQLASAEL